MWDERSKVVFALLIGGIRDWDPEHQKKECNRDTEEVSFAINRNQHTKKYVTFLRAAELYITEAPKKG